VGKLPEEIETNLNFLEEITPGFSTVTHGDPNPGNIMFRTTSTGVELKFIDPKEWMTGDYLFDIAKITHFLENTGPVEKPQVSSPPAATGGGAPGENAVRSVYRRDEDGAHLEYTIGLPNWTGLLVEACFERVAQFAGERGDFHWRARYELGMAANLLGLPLGRLAKGRKDSALILYGEGLKWLDQFCARLPGGTKRSAPAPAPGEVEPEQLRKVREWVRANITDVREQIDRRGFQLLQWEPVRPNAAGKPAELSLEHEARFSADEPAAARLLDALKRSEGQPCGKHGLLLDSPFAGLVVHRYDREAGAQSIDHYYDVPAGTGASSLIPKMITIRERIKGSSFMTWGMDGDTARPLNLELPFVTFAGSAATARLEFNWIDEAATTFREAFSAETSEAIRNRNPAFIAMFAQGLEVPDLEAVIEHTTYREKFGFSDPGDAANSREIFVVNVDLVIAQDLSRNYAVEEEKDRNGGGFWPTALQLGKGERIFSQRVFHHKR
jgi:hypothetical protein